MYRISDKIVHPMHGAGIVEDIETKRIAGKNMEYYVLRLTTGSVTVLVPVASCDAIGVRPVISAEEAEALLALFPALETEDNANWNRRYRENMEHLKSGNLKEVAFVIKSLMLREQKKPLSTGERKMLASAKQILISELTLATGRSEAEIEAILRSAIEA